jgi:chromosomal replication initiator protein
MSETDLGQVWARSLDELSDLHIEPHQRAWLRLTRPLGLVENTALIATPNEFVKEQLETRLRALVTHALSRELGRSIQLAVTVDPAATGTSAPPPNGPGGPGAPTAPPDATPAPPADGHPMSATEPGQPGAPVIIPMPREADVPGPAGQQGKADDQPLGRWASRRSRSARRRGSEQRPGEQGRPARHGASPA